MEIRWYRKVVYGGSELWSVALLPDKGMTSSANVPRVSTATGIAGDWMTDCCIR